MITLIGDVHGWYKDYWDIVDNSEYSIQLGDLDYDYSFLSTVDSSNHRFIKGNHDNYNIKTEHELGDFGPYKMDNREFFFIRGGHSIDQKTRILGIDYFDNEELSYGEGLKCLKAYTKKKPSIVLSHECPKSISRKLFPNRSLLRYYSYEDNWDSNTSKLLQALYEAHEPELWVFGHYHSFREAKFGKTRFICLPAVRNQDDRRMKQAEYRI